jgi:hypothetical protein
VFRVPVYLCIWHVLRAWQKRLWQIVGNQDKDMFQSIFMAMHGIMKTGDTEAMSDKRAMRSQLDTWFAAESKKLNAAAKYFEYWEKKVGTPDLHKQRLEILCVLRLSCHVKLTIKALDVDQ